MSITTDQATKRNDKFALKKMFSFLIASITVCCVFYHRRNRHDDRKDNEERNQRGGYYELDTEVIFLGSIGPNSKQIKGRTKQSAF